MSTKIKEPIVLIIEGISTSGKTSVFNNLKRHVKELGIEAVFVGEEETVMPCIDSTDFEHNKRYIKRLLKKTFSKKADLYVFDRLHFTYTFKTGSSLEDFDFVEQDLKGKGAKLFFLEIPRDFLKNRILESMRYRDRGWVRYVLKRAHGNPDEVVAFYQKRQEELMNLMSKSVIDKYTFDSSDQNYVRITREIVDISGLRPDQIGLEI